MATHKIALLGGDGIGQEVTPEARRVLEVVGKATGVSFEFEPALIGGAAIDAAGEPLPPSWPIPPGRSSGSPAPLSTSP